MIMGDLNDTLIRYPNSIGIILQIPATNDTFNTCSLRISLNLLICTAVISNQVTGLYLLDQEHWRIMNDLKA